MKKRLQRENDQNEVVANNHDYPPHLGRLAVLKYLEDGQLDRYPSYKEGNIPIVSLQTAKTLLLQAGYTELALSSVYFGTHTDLRESQRWPQSASEKISVTIYGPSDYSLKTGATYDGVEALKFIVSNFEPDMPAAQDSLRAFVLSQIKELEVIKQKLAHAGKDQISLSKWIFTREVDVKFWLNPWDQTSNNFGYFTIDELKAWLVDSPNPITKQKKEEKRELKKAAVNEGGVMVPRYKVELRQAMQRYSQGKTKDLRMLKILLLGCPFNDLVEQFSKKLYS